MSFDFQHPFLFWLLLALPLLLWLRGKAGRSSAIIFPTLALAKQAGARSRQGFRQWLFLFRILILALLVTALARPRLGEGQTEIQASGLDIVIALDISASMLAFDMVNGIAEEDLHQNPEKHTRLGVAQNVIRDFIRNRQNDRIGLIAFARYPYLASPLTLDYDWLLTNLNRMKVGLVEDGTAIGSAIGSSVDRLRDLDSKNRVVILVTDGQNNSGEVSPSTAAEAAEAFRTKVYTIGIGSDQKVPIPRIDNEGSFIRNYRGRLVQGGVVHPVDTETLRMIAETTGGKFYRATNREQLASIYEDIDRLETTEVKLHTYQKYEELFPWFLWPALGLLLFEQLLSHTRYRRLP